MYTLYSVIGCTIPMILTFKSLVDQINYFCFVQNKLRKEKIKIKGCKNPSQILNSQILSKGMHCSN